MDKQQISSYKYIQNKLLSAPSMRYSETEDFFAWQKRARNKLSEILGIDRFEKCDDAFTVEYERESRGYRKVHFYFQSESGYFVPCHLIMPNSQQALYNAVICLQGHSSGMHISYGEPIFDSDSKTIFNGDRDFAIRAAKEGYAAFCIEQRYMGSCGCDEKGGPACLNGDSLSALLVGRCAVGERVWDVMRLIDVIEKHFDYINAENIMCLGNSGGGTTTFYAACIDERIKCAVPSCSVCTYKDSIAAMHHCACNYVPGIANYFDMGDLGGLIAPRPLVVVHGLEDIIFPKHGVFEAFEEIKRCYAYAGANGNCTLVSGNGGHRFYADDAWPQIHKIRENF